MALEEFDLGVLGLADQLNGLSWFEPGGEGVLPIMTYTERLRKNRGIFFRLQVYERVGISLVEVYKRVGKSVIWVCERAQKG